MNFFTRHKLASVVLAIVLVLTSSNFSCGNYLQAIQEYLPQILSILSAIAPMVGLFATAISPGDGAAVKAITDEVAKDAQLIEKVYQEYQANPDTTNRLAIESALGAMLNNLPALLNASHIKDTELLGRVTNAVGIAVALANTLLATMPDKTPQVAQARAVTLKAGIKPKMVSSDGVKKEWDQFVCLGDAKCASLLPVK